MKQKLLLLWSLLLCATLGAWAGEEAITFTGAGSGTNPMVYTTDNVTFTFDKSTGNTNPAYNTTASETRLYAKGTLKISSSKKITKIVFDYTINANSKGKTPTISSVKGANADGTWDADSKTWTGSDEEITMTTTGDAGNVGFKTITVTLDDAVVAVVKPTIDGETSFVGSTEITIATTTDGATIYYTTDGVDPTASSTEYTAPFSINATTTVKAIAVKGSDVSAVASKTFTAYELSTIAEAQAAEAGTTVAIAGTVVASAANGAVIKDATDLIYYYNPSNALTVGQKVKMIGAVSSYGGAKQMPASSTIIEDGTETVTQPTAITIGEAYFTELASATEVARKYVTYTGTLNISGNYYNITIGESAVKGSLVKPKEDYSALNGKEVIVKGYQMYITGSTPRYVYTVATSVTKAPEDIVVTMDAAGNLTEAIAAAEAGKTPKNITINLNAAGTYTVTQSIVAPASVSITGVDGAVIDASGLSAAMITTPSGDLADWNIVDLQINKVKISGLKKALFVSAGKKYLYNEFSIDNSVVEITEDVIVIDFTVGGVPKTLNLTNSTLYATKATSKSFFSAQTGGNKITEYDSNAIETFNIQNTTMYNFAVSKNFFTHRQNSQKWLKFVAKNNIFVNCGKSGQVIKGMNGGGASANPQFDIDGNVFNFNGADTSADENTGDTEEPVQNSIAGVITFTNAAEGNFGGEFQLAEGATAPASVGDPRWTINFKEYVDPSVIWSNAEAIDVNWNGAIKVDADAFENVEVGDVLHVALTVTEATATKDNWKAQIFFKDKDGTLLDANAALAADDTDATLVVTGDVLKMLKANGLMLDGAGFNSKKITVETGVYEGSENSIWLGDYEIVSWNGFKIDINHVKNSGKMVAGNVVRISYTKTQDEIAVWPQHVSGSDWTNFDPELTINYITTGAEFTITEAVATLLAEDALVINGKNLKVTQIELLTAEEATSINAAKAAEAVDNGAWYTINGVRVAQPTQKGLYIHNGKKVVVK